MRIETTGLLYPAPLGAPLTPQTPPPSTDGPAAMDGDIHPAVELFPRSGGVFAKAVPRSQRTGF